MTKVSIIGPNLSGKGQRKGEFHVHAAGCSDIDRDPQRYGYHNNGNPHEYTIEADSREAVAADVYADIIDERGEGETGADYLDEFHFAPCVKF